MIPVAVALITTVPPVCAMIWLSLRGHRHTATVLDRIDHAVNCVPEGQDTLVESVRQIHMTTDRTEQRLTGHLAWHQREIED